MAWSGVFSGSGVSCDVPQIMGQYSERNVDVGGGDDRNMEAWIGACANHAVNNNELIATITSFTCAFITELPHFLIMGRRHAMGVFTSSPP